LAPCLEEFAFAVNITFGFLVEIASTAAALSRLARLGRDISVSRSSRSVFCAQAAVLPVLFWSQSAPIPLMG
jgi:hypothetical protein